MEGARSGICSVSELVFVFVNITRRRGVLSCAKRYILT